VTNSTSATAVRPSQILRGIWEGQFQKKRSGQICFFVNRTMEGVDSFFRRSRTIRFSLSKTMVQLSAFVQ
jgi:hypothetical protein